MGFRKVDPDRWEFANEGFLRGQKHLLKNITRRKPAHGQPPHQVQPNTQSSAIGACVEVGKFGLEEEVEQLKRDKNVLMQELVRLRQQQQTTDTQLQAMVQRLQGMEQRQQQMMSFLAKAVNSPGFLAQLMQQPNDSNRRISEGNKKRRLKDEGGPNGISSFTPSDVQIVKYQPLMNEAAKAMLGRMIQVDSSSRLENFGNALDSDSSANCASGVALQEMPLASAPPGESPLTGNQESPPITLPVTDAVIPQLSQMVPESNVDIMGSETEGASLMDPIPFEIDSFSPHPQMEWNDSFLDEIQELPGVGDPFWEKFLRSPPPVETEMDSTLTDDVPEGTETKPMENGWDKSQHMTQLTEKMGLLSSDADKL